MGVATCVGGCAAIWGFEDGTARNETSDATSDAPLPDVSTVDDRAPAPDGGADADASPAVDSPTGSEAGDADAAEKDAAIDVVPESGDAADAGDPCTVTTADPNAGIFVARFGNDGPSCGSQTNPCLTIQNALDLASADSLSLVYVQQGSYSESITLYPGITVVGGWQASWVKDTSPMADGLVVLQPTSASSTVVATQLSASARLCTLTVLSKAQANPGESLYGVFATGPGASLMLDDVVVVVSSGGDGVPGDAGGAPPDASTGGGCMPGDGGAGTPTGAPGAPGSAGTFTGQGYSAGTGSTGQPGATGSNGVDGGAPACVTCYGGCSALCGGTGSTTECGTRGTSGCGGIGGQAGIGGGGGGSSVGIYAWQTTVRVTNGRISVGNGGNGGLGGPGGAGGAGGSGVVGNPGASCTTGCTSCGLACCTAVQGQPAGGSAGGRGGNGGGGGAGGGGAGGSSCATAADDAGAVIVTSTMMMTGDGGTGAGGAPNGVSSTECQ